jgi:hypothetical protein
MMRQRRLDPATDVDDVGARLLVDEQQNAVVAVLPGGQLRVFRPVDRVPISRTRTGAPFL